MNICDMPISIMDQFGKLIGCTRYDFEPRYFGLNHFGWFTHLYDKKTGEDLVPKVKEKLLNGHVFEKAEKMNISGINHGLKPIIL